MRLILLVLTSLCLVTMLNAQPHDNSPIAAVAATMQTYSIRLKPGQDLKKALEAVIQQERISAGAVLTCVGSLTDLTLRLANQEAASVWREHFEIVSLVGTISMNGSHLHLAASDSTGRTIGGHLLDGCIIYTTAELVIGVMPELIYAREPDPTFGYKELMVRKKQRK